MSRDASSTPNVAPGPSPLAWQLGLAGLLPFVAGAVALWSAGPVQRPLAALALLGYGAAIVSFLGGIHWGLSMRGGMAPGLLLWGVVPSLLGWAALALPAAWGLLLLAGTLIACYAVDRRVLAAAGLQGWLPLRATLTAAATMCCLAGAAAAWRAAS